MEKYSINQRHIMEAVVVNLSILFHQRNTEWEEMEIRKNMEDLISSMDKNRIQWKLQNSLFYIGENTTCETTMLVIFLIWHTNGYMPETA